MVNNIYSTVHPAYAIAGGRTHCPVQSRARSRTCGYTGGTLPGEVRLTGVACSGNTVCITGLFGGKVFDSFHLLGFGETPNLATGRKRCFGFAEYGRIRLSLPISITTTRGVLLQPYFAPSKRGGKRCDHSTSRIKKTWLQENPYRYMRCSIRHPHSHVLVQQSVFGKTCSKVWVVRVGFTRNGVGGEYCSNRTSSRSIVHEQNLDDASV